MILHVVSFTSLFKYMWGVLECVKNCNELDISLPGHKDQKLIYNGLKEMSEAYFDNFIGAIDGLLVYIQKPALCGCREVIVGKL